MHLQAEISGLDKIRCNMYCSWIRTWGLGTPCVPKSPMIVTRYVMQYLDESISGWGVGHPHGGRSSRQQMERARQLAF